VGGGRARGWRPLVGMWWGWIRTADIGVPLAAGRFSFVSSDGWEAAFETGYAPPSRVFETELLAFRGEGGVPWPPDSLTSSDPPPEEPSPPE
jgi:hypothetical protein